MFGLVWVGLAAELGCIGCVYGFNCLLTTGAFSDALHLPFAPSPTKPSFSMLYKIRVDKKSLIRFAKLLNYRLE